MCGVFIGLLRNPQGPRGQLAVPDVRPGRSAQVFAVSQERRSDEAHPQRDQVGARQLCAVDPRGGYPSGGSAPEPVAAHSHGEPFIN